MKENYEEIWADIKDYEGLYQISNLGRVKRLKKKGVVKDKLLKSRTNKDGYCTITLTKDFVRRGLVIHRLLAQAFIGNVYGLQVEHINKDKTDNNWLNLKIVTCTSKVKNRPKRKGCSSKYKGVSWDKEANNWRARMTKKGKGIHLGSFDTEIEAALYYDKKVPEDYITNKSLGLL